MATELYVLDSSVAVSWFFTDEAQHGPAVDVRSAVRSEPRRFAVPPLFHSEVIHALARKWGRDADRVRRAMALLIAFGFPTLTLPERALLRACDWSCQGLSGYDATFVALAEELGGRWVTADARAAALAGEFAVSLADWG